MNNRLKKILYVEDEPDIAEITKMMLETLGDFEVHHCPSGIQALKDIEAFSPQLVLLDMMMPVMDGEATIRELKKLPASQNIPVIFLTAKAQVYDRGDYKALGAIGAIIKPYDPPSLCHAVEAMWEASLDD